MNELSQSLQMNIFASMLVPVIGALLIFACARFRGLIELIFVGTALCLLGVTISIVNLGSDAFYQSISFFTIIDSIPIAFHVEPLGILYACVASGLWLVTTIYAIGYMNANKEKHLARFYMCFCLAMAAVMGIAYSANLLTLFIFYELLTLSTYPLVAHKGTDDAKAGARVYLGILIGTSIGFLLIAILWTWSITGTLDFSVGGILENELPDGLLMLLFALYAFGIGKAALMPFHRWLPSAMVAPTPVSALLHAVAVVKAGVFCVLKVTVYVFGIDVLTSTGANSPIIWVATATMLLASLVALQQDNLKARLAYSTVSQLAYIVLGAVLATSTSIMGSSLHLATHAVGKITLFFCAGAIYTATKKTLISDMHGLGRIMPFTFAAYTIAAISIIGLPPLAGGWSKWFLIDGAISADRLIIAIAFLVSTLLNIVYLMPIAINGFMATPKQANNGIQEAPFAVVMPLCVTAGVCFVLFFLLPYVHDYLLLLNLR
ncbi:MAG: proton-conducting transporter membrane subunit [Gammaproteobacteria bacterium]